jgi:hypothetical protein
MGPGASEAFGAGRILRLGGRKLLGDGRKRNYHLNEMSFGLPRMRSVLVAARRAAFRWSERNFSRPGAVSGSRMDISSTEFGL